MSSASIPEPHTYPLKPSPEAPPSDWIYYFAAVFLTLFKIISTSFLQFISGANEFEVKGKEEILEKMQQVVMLINLMWFDVMPIVDKSSIATPVTSLRKSEVRVSPVGDRVVVMSFETEIGVKSALWMEVWIENRIGIRVSLRWLADWRNQLWLFVGLFSVLLVYWMRGDPKAPVHKGIRKVVKPSRATKKVYN